MSSEQPVLAIDVGTQSAGAFAFDAAGRLIDGARARYDAPYFSPHPGWAEQDPAHYWVKLGEACRKLFSQGAVKPEDLAAVCLTSQRCTVINLDEQGRSLRPAMVWLDQRRADRLPPMPWHWRWLFRLTGLNDTLHYLQAEAEANWIMQHQPEVWERTRHCLFLSGYLNHRLTGRMADSTACQVGYVPFDYRRHDWARPWDWKWRAIPLDRDLLPELVPPGQPLGEVTAGAADLTGLPAGLPVIAGATDKACEVLGSGCLELHQGCIGYGTTATINVNSPRYIEPIRLVPCYPSAQTGFYNLEVQIYRGFWMVTWFKEQFAHAERLLAREKGIITEELLEEMARRVPAGSLGLTLQPYWTPGLRYPGHAGKGSIIGFGAAHTKEHMYRALLEGLAYGLKEGKERIEKKTRRPLTELRVCGGGSRSDLMMQITADVFNLPASRPTHSETSALGAAVLAASGAGLHPDTVGAVGAMTGRGRTFQPSPADADTYSRLYNKVYRRIYPRLGRLYKEIMEITGYPQRPGDQDGSGSG